MNEEKRIKRRKLIFNLDKLWEIGSKPIDMLDYMANKFEEILAEHAYSYRLLDYNKWYDRFLCWLYEKLYI